MISTQSITEIIEHGENTLELLNMLEHVGVFYFKQIQIHFQNAPLAPKSSENSLIIRCPKYIRIEATGLYFPPEISGPPLQSSEKNLHWTKN